MQSPHLLLALSGHGYGHLAQCAAVINVLWTRIPGLRLTVCGMLPREVIAARLDGDFDYRQVALDPVLQMFNAWEVNIAASLQVYRMFHSDWERGLQQDMTLLQELEPALVLADVPFRILLAAAQLDIPTVGMCSLNWAAVYRTYCDETREDERILSQMWAGYQAADVFITPEPAIPMPELNNVCAIGPIARQGFRQQSTLLDRCTAASDVKIVLVALGGIATELPLDTWPRIDKIIWLFPGAVNTARTDIIDFTQLALPFIDVLASADVVLTKPGYGTYVEAVCNRIPVLTIERPDWVETACLNNWVQQHGHLEVMTRDEFFNGTFAPGVHSLLAKTARPGLEPTGASQAADLIQGRMALT